MCIYYKQCLWISKKPVRTVTEIPADLKKKLASKPKPKAKASAEPNPSTSVQPTKLELSKDQMAELKSALAPAPVVKKPRKPREPLSEQAKQKLRDQLVKAREVRAQKKAEAGK